MDSDVVSRLGDKVETDEPSTVSRGAFLQGDPAGGVGAWPEWEFSRLYPDGSGEKSSAVNVPGFGTVKEGAGLHNSVCRPQYHG